MMFEDAFLAAVNGLSANAQVCARNWSPEMLANRAAAIAEAASKRLEGGEDLAPDTVSTRDRETEMLVRDLAEVARKFLPKNEYESLGHRINRWLEGCG